MRAPTTTTTALPNVTIDYHALHRALSNVCDLYKERCKWWKIEEPQWLHYLNTHLQNEPSDAVLNGITFAIFKRNDTELQICLLYHLKLLDVFLLSEYVKLINHQQFHCFSGSSTLEQEALKALFTELAKQSGTQDFLTSIPWGTREGVKRHAMMTADENDDCSEMHRLNPVTTISSHHPHVVFNLLIATIAAYLKAADDNQKKSNLSRFFSRKKFTPQDVGNMETLQKIAHTSTALNDDQRCLLLYAIFQKMRVSHPEVLAAATDSAMRDNLVTLSNVAKYHSEWWWVADEAIDYHKTVGEILKIALNKSLRSIYGDHMSDQLKQVNDQLMRTISRETFTVPSAQHQSQEGVRTQCETLERPLVLDSQHTSSHNQNPPQNGQTGRKSYEDICYETRGSVLPPHLRQ